MVSRNVQLRIERKELDSTAVVIALAGRLMLGPEGAQVESTVKELLARGFRRFIFDFSELTHIDSTGIGRCIAALNLVMQAKGSLAIAGATGHVREGFRVTQLDRVFRFYEDVPSAGAALV